MQSMIVLLMIFLVSCKSHTIVDVQMCDVSFVKDRCRCRLVNLNTLEAKSEAVNYEITHCEEISGFFLNDVAVEIKPKVKAKMKYCQDAIDD